MDQRRPVRAPAPRPARQSPTHIAPVWQATPGTAVRRTQDVRPVTKPKPTPAQLAVPTQPPARPQPAQPQFSKPVQQQPTPAPAVRPVAASQSAVLTNIAPASHVSHKPAQQSQAQADVPTVSIKITVPDSESLQKVLAWRPTPKQIVITIVMLFIFTIGYQMGRHDGAHQTPQAAYVPNSLLGRTA